MITYKNFKSSLFLACEEQDPYIIRLLLYKKKQYLQNIIHCLEMDKLLAKKTSDLREVQVVDAMEDICQSKYFKTYDLSPPTSVKVCRFLIGEL